MEMKKKLSIHNPVKSSQINNDAYEANMKLQERFYEDESREEDSALSLSNSSNFGTFILPEDV
ncbi:hypothetical protein [Metabacillus halosaccharovorans]|uniref:hypothetical protein n=1 Tax=Metabacillus halosaccharovorans TaxID=930124 RepID=UPI001C1FEC2E|nr:hypothetical protein [Metabacillus halosaccharovorans]MBU7593600.1 hypothetical protein [Metabacillus halosaccharovorans]